MKNSPLKSNSAPRALSIYLADLTRKDWKSVYYIMALASSFGISLISFSIKVCSIVLFLLVLSGLRASTIPVGTEALRSDPLLGSLLRSTILVNL